MFYGYPYRRPFVDLQGTRSQGTAFCSRCCLRGVSDVTGSFHLSRDPGLGVAQCLLNGDLPRQRLGDFFAYLVSDGRKFWNADVLDTRIGPGRLRRFFGTQYGVENMGRKWSGSLIPRTTIRGAAGARGDRYPTFLASHGSDVGLGRRPVDEAARVRLVSRRSG